MDRNTTRAGLGRAPTVAGTDMVSAANVNASPMTLSVEAEQQTVFRLVNDLGLVKP